MARHRIEVQRMRKTYVPEAGPEAYRLQYETFEYPYGKTQHFKTGNDAVAAAEKKFDELETEPFDELVLVAWSGHNGTVLKRTVS